TLGGGAGGGSSLAGGGSRERSQMATAPATKMAAAPAAGTTQLGRLVAAERGRVGTGEPCAAPRSRAADLDAAFDASEPALRGVSVRRKPARSDGVSAEAPDSGAN